MPVSFKFKHDLSFNTAVPFLGIYARTIKAYFHKNSYKNIPNSQRTRNNPNVHKTEEWINCSILLKQYTTQQ